MNLASLDPVSLALLLGALALLPLLLTVCTSFLKIAMVLMIVRNATGVQQVPPSISLYAVALTMTLFVMGPTFASIWGRIAPEGEAQRPKVSIELIHHAAEPMRQFLLKHSKPEQRSLFLATAKRSWAPELAKEASDQDYLILIPAFVVSQMQVAFEIGFLLYVPFVVIDLILATVLQALGMNQVSPQTLSVPLKLLLFVMVDGWGKLLHGLVESYS